LNAYGERVPDLASTAVTSKSPKADATTGFIRGLNLFDSTMIVVGSMIGSGIFIVSADIARHTGSSGGLLLTWVVTGFMTLAAALSYGELAAMMPKAGGQYIYLREAYSPLWGFLYGWTLFLVIQTGTIAAVAVGFSRFLGVIWPKISPDAWIIPPIALSAKYAISLSAQQLVALLLIVLLTFLNTLGLRLGKIIQNVFTSAKTVALIGVILIGIVIGRNAGALHANFNQLWALHDAQTIEPGADWLKSFMPSVTAASGFFGLIVAFAVAQVGSLFSADAWNNITFTAGEVKNPKRDIPLSLVFGTGLVVTLYVLANIGYLSAISLHQIQTAPDDRVATATLAVIFGSGGATLMALTIIVSTFGCANGLILAGARVYYVMAQDGLFFRSIGRLNANHVPATGLVLQCVWACVLLLLRTRIVNSATVAITYGNLYSVLLDYVVFAILIFYVLTISAIFVLRKKQPHAERPYRVWGYPVIPALYVVMAFAIMLILIVYQTQDTWPGLVIVLLGVPAYFLWRKRPISGAQTGLHN
jgi:basic amino acid/polyamine antiporter, APA family